MKTELEVTPNCVPAGTLDVVMEFLDAVTKRKDESVFVYFIQGGDLVKIGLTDDFHSRFQTLKSMSPIPLIFRGAIKCDRFFEKILHWRFSHLRTHGEWFHFNKEIVDFLWKYSWDDEARQEWIDECGEKDGDD